jgi:hypothetical protein
MNGWSLRRVLSDALHASRKLSYGFLSCVKRHLFYWNSIIRSANWRRLSELRTMFLCLYIYVRRLGIPDHFNMVSWREHRQQILDSRLRQGRDQFAKPPTVQPCIIETDLGNTCKMKCTHAYDDYIHTRVYCTRPDCQTTHSCSLEISGLS